MNILTLKMIVTNAHDKLIKEDYDELENGLIDSFQEAIFNEVKESISNKLIKKEEFNLIEYRYCKFLNLLKNDKFEKVIERIPLILEESNINYDDLVDPLKSNNKKSKNSKIKIIVNQDFMKIDKEILLIQNFCDKIIDKKRIDIKNELLNIGFNEHTFYYMVIYLLTFSEKGKRSKNKEKYTWNLNLPDILNIEIIKTLKELNSDISNKLLTCFDLTNITNDILQIYPDIIFNPLIFSKLNNKENQITLREEQKVSIQQIKSLIENYKNFIINGYDMKKTYWIQSACFGGGKTSVCSIASTTFVNESNKEISKQEINVKFNEYNFTMKKKMILLFIVPSKQVLISFGKNAANYFSTWFANTKEDNKINIEVMHKYTPQYKKKLRKNVKIEYFKYHKEVNKTDEPIVHKFLNLILWHRLHKRNDKLWIGGYDYYKPPEVIFCDPKGAEELVNNRYDFESKLGWYFLPVVDEWVATIGDCVDENDNHYLKSIKNIIFSNLKLQFLISASVNKNEVMSNEYFNQYNLVFAPVIPRTNSLTEMYTYKKKLVHPFSKVKFNNVNEAIDSWDSTIYRCFTPTVLIEYCKILNYTIEYNDIHNITSYLQLVENVLTKIKQSDEDIKKQICELKLTNYKKINFDDSKTLYLTSSSVSDEIFRYIDNKLNKNLVLKKVNDDKLELRSEIINLQNEKNDSKRLKIKSLEGNEDDIDKKIFDLEKLLESDEQTFIFTSNFGRTTVTEKWINNWINILDDKELTVVLSGYDLSFNDRTLDEAVKDISSVPYQIIDTITSMFGRNDPSVKNVVINDINKKLGIKTIMQGIARAGRSGKQDCIVTATLNEFLLKKFNYTKSLLDEVFNYDKWIESD